MNRLFLIMLCIACIFLSACNGNDKENNNSSEKSQTIEDDIASKKEEESVDYSEVENLFAEIIPDSDVSVSLKGERLRVKIETSLASNTASDEWSIMMQDLTSALISADELSESYQASIVSVEVYAEDETILASGFDGALRFNLFEEKEPEGKENPPTISKFEYDQVMVGMSLTEVRELIGSDGVLQSEVGTAGVTDVIRTYRWFGEKDGSYADILFSEYKVYSKVELWLD